jgi:hypothetical protein
LADRTVRVTVSAQDNFSSVMDRYNRQMGQAEQATRRADQANQQATSGFGRLGTAIGGAIAAIGIHQVISFAEEFNELGTQVNIATQTFEQLSDSIDPNNELLARLQDATGGIVSNLDLMSGATRLLSMGLATNSDEVERLTELAVRLGGAMGNDAQQSIENFSLLLANESVLRLDSFGISSSRVRQRIDELLASGEALNRSEAFRLAVLEEGGRSLERLGDAASAAETPLARLQTRLENIAHQGASNFTTGVNATIAFVEDVTEFTIAENDLNEAAFQWLQTMGAQPQGNLFGSAIYTSEQIAQARQAMQIQEEYNRLQQEGLQATLDAQAELRNQTPLIADTPFSFGDQFIKPDETLTAFQAVGQEIVTISDLISNLNPLVNAGTAAWEQTAAAVLRVQEAYSNISLGQLMGEGQGNLALGGLGDMVIQELQTRGNLDADALQSAADAYNLAAGRITEVSITMRDTVAPLLAQITEARGGDVGAQRAGQVEEYLRRLNATGQEDNPFAGLGLTLATGAIPVGEGMFDFQSILVEPFQERLAELQESLGSESALGQQAADSLGRLPEGVDTAIERTGELQGALDAMTSREYSLAIRVDHTELDAFINKLNSIQGMAGAGNLQTMVQDNGGVVPGAGGGPRGHGPF